MRIDPPARVDEVFQAALDLPAHERAAFVERACADDAPLGQAVQRLLASHERAQAARFMEVDVSSSTAGPSPGGQDSPGAGQLISRYRVVDRIGSGGLREGFLGPAPGAH